eukprot:3415359-Rhodomonas_salina.1
MPRCAAYVLTLVMPRTGSNTVHVPGQRHCGPSPAGGCAEHCPRARDQVHSQLGRHALQKLPVLLAWDSSDFSLIQYDFMPVSSRSCRHAPQLAPSAANDHVHSEDQSKIPTLWYLPHPDPGSLCSISQCTRLTPLQLPVFKLFNSRSSNAQATVVAPGSTSTNN